jgi:hypothetical protein
VGKRTRKEHTILYGSNTPHNSPNPILTMEFLKIFLILRHLHLTHAAIANTALLLLPTCRRLAFRPRALHAPRVLRRKEVRLGEKEVEGGVTVCWRGGKWRGRVADM